MLRLIIVIGCDYTLIWSNSSNFRTSSTFAAPGKSCLFAKTNKVAPSKRSSNSN